MGSCISKCKPSKRKNSNKNEEDQDNSNSSSIVQVPVEDKLVIITSENPHQLKSPPPPFPPLSTTQNPSFLPLFSPSQSSYSSSSSSNTCLSTSSSSASSISTTKEKPFSKESFHSRLNQNPQIVVLDPTKLGGGSAGGAPSSLPPQIGGKWQVSGLPSRPSSPAAGPAQKRQRASSPFTGHKSFRKDPIGATLTTANRTPSFRSPSPSRRFSRTEHECSRKRVVGDSKVHGSYGKSNINVVSNSVKKQKPQAVNDPNSRSRRSFRSPSMRKQAEICNLNKVVSKVDGMRIGEETSLNSRDVEMFPVEDLDNPLIALDCFIFL